MIINVCITQCRRILIAASIIPIGHNALSLFLNQKMRSLVKRTAVHGRSLAEFVTLSRRCLASSSRLRNRKLPDLTSERYPHVKRGDYATLSQEDVSFFREVLPEASQVLTTAEDLQGYNTDWMGIVRGQS